MKGPRYELSMSWTAKRADRGATNVRIPERNASSSTEGEGSVL
jgi:hypothetical protein